MWPTFDHFLSAGWTVRVRIFWMSSLVWGTLASLRIDSALRMKKGILSTPMNARMTWITLRREAQFISWSRLHSRSHFFKCGWRVSYVTSVLTYLPVLMLTSSAEPASKSESSTEIMIDRWRGCWQMKGMWLPFDGANSLHTSLVCLWPPWRNAVIGLALQYQHWKPAAGQGQKTLDSLAGLLLKLWGQEGQPQKGGWQGATCHQNPWSESM